MMAAETVRVATARTAASEREARKLPSALADLRICPVCGVHSFYFHERRSGTMVLKGRRP